RSGSGAGHLPNGEVRDGQVLLPGGEQGVGDSGAEPAFGVVVFGDHDSPGGGLGSRGEGGGVDWLDGVAVDDAGGDPFGGQGLGGVQAFVQGDSGADQSDLVVVAGAEHLGAADGEGLPGVVEAGVGAAGGAQVADSGGDGHRLDQRGGAGAVGRIQHGRALHRAHHGQVLQRHLGGPVGADLDTG